MADDENELLADTGYAIYALFERIANGPDDFKTLQALNSIINEGDRFKIWSTSTGLLIPGHGSLDYRVREAVSLSKTLHSFLIDLRDNLEEVWDLVDSQSISVPEAENGAAEIDDEADENDDTPINPDQIMSILFVSIRDIIDRLFRLATKLRSPETRLRSSRAQKFQRLDGGVDLFSSFAEFEHDYVASVFRQYRRGPKLADSAEQETSPDGDSKLRIDDEASRYLIERITSANLARRRQFAYWQHHSLKLEKHTEAAIAVRKSARSTKDASFLPASLNPRLANAAPAMTISTATQLLQPTRDFSDLTSMASMSEYVPSPAEAYGESVVFPPPPHVPMVSKFFMCPYCCTTCARKTLGTKAWQAHLIHDLRPYVCTYGDCRTPHQLYDSKADWIQHETTSHASAWTCSVHPDKVFDDAVTFRLHIADGHIQTALVNGNNQQAIVIKSMDKTSRSCPICSRLDIPMSQLNDHIATHLERLAIFSLPKRTDIAEANVGSQNSNKANVEEDSRDIDTKSSLSFDSARLSILGESLPPEEHTHQQPISQLEDLELTYQRELAEKEETLGIFHFQTLDTVVKLGDLYTQQHQLDRAEQLYTRALAGFEKTSELDPRFTLEIASKLGSTYHEQGKNEKAEQMYLRALAGFEERLGPDHLSTLNVVHSLASTYHDQDQQDKAEQMHLRALTGYEKVVGPDHEMTINTAMELVDIYIKQDKWEQAEQVWFRIFYALDDEHSIKHSAIHKIAIRYSTVGRIEQSIVLMEQLVKISVKTLGEDHLDTVASMNKLASNYGNNERYQEAVQLLEHVVKVRESKLGKEHPDTLTSIDSLAIQYGNVSRYEEAIELLEQIVRKRQSKLGKEHPDTLTSIYRQAVLYGDVGQHEKALRLMEQVVQARTRVLGEEHPDTLESTNRLAMYYGQVGRYTEALQLMEQVIQERTRIHGEEHPDTLASKYGLAILYGNASRYEEAIELLEQLVQMWQGRFGKEHSLTLESTNRLALCYSQVGRHEEALKLLEEIVMVRKSKLGDDHPDTLESIDALAEQHEKVGWLEGGRQLGEEEADRVLGGVERDKGDGGG